MQKEREWDRGLSNTEFQISKLISIKNISPDVERIAEELRNLYPDAVRLTLTVKWAGSELDVWLNSEEDEKEKLTFNK